MSQDIGCRNTYIALNRYRGSAATDDKGQICAPVGVFEANDAIAGMTRSSSFTRKLADHRAPVSVRFRQSTAPDRDGSLFLSPSLPVRLRDLFREATATAPQERHSELGATDDVANGLSRSEAASEIVDRPCVALEVGVDGVSHARKRSGVRRAGADDAARCRGSDERQPKQKFPYHLGLSFLCLLESGGRTIPGAPASELLLIVRA
jgi:hypothetical protein